MDKTADWTDVHKTTIGILNIESKPQQISAKEPGISKYFILVCS